MVMLKTPLDMQPIHVPYVPLKTTFVSAVQNGCNFVGGY